MLTEQYNFCLWFKRSQTNLKVANYINNYSSYIKQNCSYLYFSKQIWFIYFILHDNLKFFVLSIEKFWPYFLNMHLSVSKLFLKVNEKKN